MSSQPTAPPRTPPAAAATLIGFGTLMLFLTGRGVLAPFGILGMGLAEWLFMALPVLLALHFGGFSLPASLGLRVVSGRVLLGGTLLMVGGMSLNWVVAWAQSRWIPIPVEVAEAMTAQFSAQGGLELLLILGVAALTPAICEELLFRGLLLRAWRGWPASVAIGVNAILFGAIHWLPGSAFRVLPAATSGALIAWAVWQTRSLWTGIWMHLLNNGLLLLASAAVMASEGAAAEAAASATAPTLPSIWILLPMFAMVAAGLHLLRTHSSPQPSPT